MIAGRSRSPVTEPTRRPAVAGTFYPASAARLESMVQDLLEEARWLPGAAGHPGPRPPGGLLVPHAGLVYSGIVAAAGWSQLAIDGHEANPSTPPTVIVLGTNHAAAWLDGVGVWPAGAWRTPIGDVAVDHELAAAIGRLGRPFLVEPAAHVGEHSIEVQLPILQAVAPGARIVPLAVSAGIGHPAIEAGRRLGELIAARRSAGMSIVLAISSDMAHYPAADDCSRVTGALLPKIRTVDGAGLAASELAVRGARIPGLVCGMCGIEPAVLGLAALQEMGVAAGHRLAGATSADTEGPADRTVGYLSVRFD